MEIENDITLRTDLTEERSTENKSHVIVPSKFISLTHEINEISITNFPTSLKLQIFTFKALHYILLVTSIVLIIVKRIKEHTDIMAIEKIEDITIKRLFYVITGLIYVKYNLEIINFICFYIFVINLHERKSRAFYFKIIVETFISLLIFIKIVIYIFELWGEYGFTGSINHHNIIGECIMLVFHISIIVLYCKIRAKFSDSRLLRKIFIVFYLNRELTVK